MVKNKMKKNIVNFRFLKTNFQHTKIYKNKFTWGVGGVFGGLGLVGGGGGGRLFPRMGKFLLLGPFLNIFFGHIG